MKQISEIIPDLFQGGFIIYCGAGISIPAPSCAPSWWTLTEEILKAFFGRIPNDWGLPKDLIIKDPNKKPEEVFENFAHMLDIRLFKIFKALNVTEPNGNHQIIAKLAKLGVLKACITTNFDIFIERSLKDEGVQFDLLVDNKEYIDYFKRIQQKPSNSPFLLCKIHGTIDQPSSIVSIASAYKSSKGFSSPKADLITELLKKYVCLFLGYSGYDFEHLNYRRFWERVGPMIKGIYWNNRPNESNSVDFQSIFHNCWNSFQFCQGNLPEDLYSALKNYSKVQLPMDNIVFVDSSQNALSFQKAVENRANFFLNWVNEIPEPFIIGLVLSEANQFSEKYKGMLKDLKEVSEDKETINYSNMINIQEIALKMQKGEITQEQYMSIMNDYLLQTRLMYIRKSWKPIILEIMKKNEFPGITDNNQKRDQWLGFLSGLGNYNVNDAVKISIDIVNRFGTFAVRSDDDAKIERQIIGYLPTMMHPKKELWEPYYSHMMEVKDVMLSGKIDYNSAQKQIQTIYDEYNNEKLGMTIDLLNLFRKLIKLVTDSVDYEQLVESCEALVLSINYVSTYIFAAMMKEENFVTIYQGLTSSIAQHETLEESRIDNFYMQFRNYFTEALNKVNCFGDVPLPKILLEIAILRFWAVSIQYIDSIQMQKYTKAWDSGDYPFRFTNPAIYTFTINKVKQWKDQVFSLIPPQYLQKVLGYLVSFAESGNDFEFVRLITLKSLELSEGIVTEATPMEIPSSLAGFYDKMGDKVNALKYYTLALDAIKTTVPPLWQDVIVYRSAVLTVELSNNSHSSMIEALNIIHQFHPEFRGNAGILKTPARSKCIDFANEISKKLIFNNAQEAIQSLFSQKV